MANQFQKINFRDLSRGIDQRSAPTSIPDGFAEDLQNVDTNSNGFLSKRPGYQGYYGYLPVRVLNIQHIDTSIVFTIDSSFDTTGVDNIPIVVYGRLSGSQSGDWSDSDNAEYYLIATVDLRYVLDSGSNTLTVPETETGINTDTQFAAVVASLSATDNSSSFIFADSIDINDSDPFDVDVNYTVPVDTAAFIYFSDKTPVVGTTYVQEDTIPSTSTTTVTIPLSSHNLTSFSIIPQFYYHSGSEWVQFIPNFATVDVTTGEVQYQVTNSGGSGLAVRAILTAAPVPNTMSISIPPMTTDTMTITTDEDFYFMSVWSSSGSLLSLVIPDAIVRDSNNNTIDVTITNSSVSTTSYTAYYEFTELTSSTITVTDNSNTSTTYADSEPQLTIWGIPHAGHYDDAHPNGGMVNHIDSYRSELVEYLVSGVGGNIFKAGERDAVGVSYLIPTTDVDLEARVSAATTIGPAFQTSSTGRTRGCVGSSNVVDGYNPVTAVSLASSGVTTYTIDFQSKTGLLSTAINTAGNIPDYLTVTGMAHAVHNGRFKILSTNDSSNTITVSNPLVTLSDFDETGALGLAGSFTDEIPLVDFSRFLAGDTISCSILEATAGNSSQDTVQVYDVTDNVSMPGGLAIFGSRSASIAPVEDTTNFVTGDMCGLTGVNRKVRITYINNDDDQDIDTITGDGTTATVELANPHHLRNGQQVVLLHTDEDDYTGIHTITSIPTIYSFTFASSSTASVLLGSDAIVAGQTLEFDEELDVQDAAATPTSVTVEGRWIPIEAPDTEDNIPDTTHYRYFDDGDYADQSTLRSTMVSNNLYLTNHADEVFKYDGSTNYQAGLFRWQPELFAQVDTTVPSILESSVRITYSAVDTAENSLEVDTTAPFSVGSRVVDDDTDDIYTVSSIDVTNTKLFFVEPLAAVIGGSDTIRLTSRFKYYFRLNAIDANQNVIASAVTGANDFIVDLNDSGQIHLRLVGFPAWGVYDYDRIELQVYRTTANTEAPFYLVRTVDVSFDVGDGYIDIQDGTTDETLAKTANLDAVNTALKGAELGTAWTQPPRSKYVTTAENRMILANIKDYPELDIVLRKNPESVAVTAANLADIKLLLHKDVNDVSTTTNMVDRATYQWRTSGAVTITPATDITASTADFTVTKTAHGLSVGNWVYLFHAAQGTTNKLTFAGWHQISSVTADTFTILFNSDGTDGGANDVNRYVTAVTPTDIPVWIGTDGNRNQVGSEIINEFTAVTRMAEAINASMRLSVSSGFKPWVVAQAGSDIGIGRLVLRQERVFTESFSMVVPSAPSTASWFVQGIQRDPTDSITSSSRVFPSRVVVSYVNYPEIFDNPFASQGEGDSVVDVNSADGQEITGVIPFFGESVFGGGQVEGTLVVFKTNSIYLLDLASRGLSKLQSRGLGCTAPYSIASTRDGIMFANEAGVYRLNRDQSISYVGQMVERIWQDEVNKDQLAVMTGHHYSTGSKYKLSVPLDGENTNSQVLVYDHQREGRDQEYGAWTRYTNHAATGWANLATESFFSTTDGQVFKIRNAGDSSDYRDDASAVDTMLILLKAMDFGVAGVRKIVRNVIAHFQLRRSSMFGTEIEVGADLKGTFSSAGIFTFTKNALVKAVDALVSLPQRKMEFLQIKITNDTKDEDVILTGIDADVVVIGDRGIKDRSETT